MIVEVVESVFLTVSPSLPDGSIVVDEMDVATGVVSFVESAVTIVEASVSEVVFVATGTVVATLESFTNSEVADTVSEGAVADEVLVSFVVGVDSSDVVLATILPSFVAVVPSWLESVLRVLSAEMWLVSVVTCV